MSDNEKIIVKVDKDLEDLMPTFLENRKNDVGKIKDSLNEGDFQAIRMIGHSLQGVGGGYGFDNITLLGEKINKAAKESNADLIKQLAKEIEDFLEKVEVEYE